MAIKLKQDSNPQSPIIDAILVPQGAEYQAVCRGLQSIQVPKPQVLPIPIGSQALRPYLEKWQQTPEFLNNMPTHVLMLGLAGSLSPRYRVGDVLLYQACGYVCTESKLSWQFCDRQLTDLLRDRLQDRASLVRGLTSDRLIWSAAQKRHLGEEYGVGGVDMEGYAALEVLQNAGIAVGTIRVISDGCQQNLPNLSPAFSADGSLKPLPLAWSMAKRPLAAWRLIQGSLKGLAVLERLVGELYQVWLNGCS
jgi:hypothetical protein